MTNNLENLKLMQLEDQLTKINNVYDIALQEGKSHSELLEIYKKIKSIQQEIALRRMETQLNLTQA